MADSPKPVILVVDDNPAVGRLMTDILAMSGYNVILAAEGKEAIRICEELPAPVDLLISDVVMPGISGPELCKHLSCERRALRCLLISGYSQEALAGSGAENSRFPLLTKPFNMIELVNTVRSLLATPVSHCAR
jgi:two-component system, cell cycle sensor histidine kinase and response regulator CckA